MTADSSALLAAFTSALNAFDQYVKGIVRDTVQETPLPDLDAKIASALSDYDPTENHNFVPVVNNLVKDQINKLELVNADDLADYAEENHEHDDYARDDHTHDQLDYYQREEVRSLINEAFERDTRNAGLSALQRQQVTDLLADNALDDARIANLLANNPRVQEALAGIAKAQAGGFDPEAFLTNLKTNEKFATSVINWLNDHLAVQMSTPDIHFFDY